MSDSPKIQAVSSRVQTEVSETARPKSRTHYDPHLEYGDPRKTLPRAPARLKVTSTVHPFWGTKRGFAVICFLVLVVVGAVVGGVVGGRVGKDEQRLPPTTSSSTASEQGGATSALTKRQGGDTEALFGMALSSPTMTEKLSHSLGRASATPT